ncbi:MAG: hypothetical protein MHM6MM_006158, partial [Cercozoa sp. M6MM]
MEARIPSFEKRDGKIWYVLCIDSLGYRASRRYAQFVDLHRRLERAIELNQRTRGLIQLPPLPEHSSWWQRKTDEFLEQRRRELEVYLQRVLSHRILFSSPITQRFLKLPVPRQASGPPMTPIGAKMPTATETRSVSRERPGAAPVSPILRRLSSASVVSNLSLSSTLGSFLDVSRDDFEDDLDDRADEEIGAAGRNADADRARITVSRQSLLRQSLRRVHAWLPRSLLRSVVWALLQTVGAPVHVSSLHEHSHDGAGNVMVTLTTRQEVALVVPATCALSISTDSTSPASISTDGDSTGNGSIDSGSDTDGETVLVSALPTRAVPLRNGTRVVLASYTPMRSEVSMHLPSLSLSLLLLLFLLGAGRAFALFLSLCVLLSLLSHLSDELSRGELRLRLVPRQQAPHGWPCEPSLFRRVRALRKVGCTDGLDELFEREDLDDDAFVDELGTRVAQCEHDLVKRAVDGGSKRRHFWQWLGLPEQSDKCEWHKEDFRQVRVCAVDALTAVLRQDTALAVDLLTAPWLLPALNANDRRYPKMRAVLWSLMLALRQECASDSVTLQAFLRTLPSQYLRAQEAATLQNKQRHAESSPKAGSSRAPSLDRVGVVGEWRKAQLFVLALDFCARDAGS